MLLLGMVLVLACKSRQNEPAPVVSELAFEVSATAYEQAIATRTSRQYGFDIKEIKREGDILKVFVRGGCDKNNYKIIWDGIMRKSYPLTLFFVISYEKSTGVECAAELDHVLELNLKEKLGDVYTTQSYHILLSNGSKVYDKVITPDGIVSDK